MGNVAWDYDFKRDLLLNYDEENPIKNFLEFKKMEYYKKNNSIVEYIFETLKLSKDGYREVIGKLKIITDSEEENKVEKMEQILKNSRDKLEEDKVYGKRDMILNILNTKSFDLEYSSKVDNIFEIVLDSNKGYKGTEKEYRDVMNSFWTTYKCLLQTEYPEIFLFGGKLYRKQNTPLVYEGEKKPKLNFPPLYIDGKSNGLYKLGIKFVNYINSMDNMELKVDENDSWIGFLLKNFDKFNKVHENENLKEFAKLTHTVGNFIILPISTSNWTKSEEVNDYMDLYLYKYKGWITKRYPEWAKTREGFVERNKLGTYYIENVKVMEFWEGHLCGEPLPENKKQIEDFLKFVNNAIEERGRKITEDYKKNRKK